MKTRSLGICLFIALAGGCTPTLYAVSTPPPTRTARLYSKQPVFGNRKHFVEISAGVALAFNCSDGGPCRRATATSDDPGVAQVMPAHLDQLELDYLNSDTTPPATFVLTGVRPGETVVRVRSADGNASIKVKVVE